MKYIITQNVIETTIIEAHSEEEALDLFYSGDYEVAHTNYGNAPTVTEGD